MIASKAPATMVTTLAHQAGQKKTASTMIATANRKRQKHIFMENTSSIKSLAPFLSNTGVLIKVKIEESHFKIVAFDKCR